MTPAEMLEGARASARRHRHAVAEPVHALAALVTSPHASRIAIDHGLDPTELAQTTDAALAARDARGGYRDGSEPEISPSLTRVVDRVGSRWRPMPFAALSLEPDVAELVLLLRRGGDARYVLERATALAVVRGHREIGLAHCIRVLLDVPSFSEALRRAGSDDLRVRGVLEATLATEQRNERRLRPSFDGVVSDAMASAARLADAEDALFPKIVHFCLALATVDQHGLAELGVDREALLRTLAAIELESLRARSLLR
jgi:ATP-dependent Clp protease ATP-binding subunit ClpA